MRRGHPLAGKTMTPARFAAGRHILVARRGIGQTPVGQTPAGQTPVDRALDPLGLRRDIAVIVGSFAEALALARGSDLIASVPERSTQVLRDRSEEHTSELQSLMRISYAVFCLKKKRKTLHVTSNLHSVTSIKIKS